MQIAQPNLNQPVELLPTKPESELSRSIPSIGQEGQ
jgi:hypothetical protein